MSERNKIVVVGNGAEKLVQKLVGSKSSNGFEMESVKLPLYPWTIDNKYYSANVEFLVLEMDPTCEHSTYHKLHKHIGDICEAIILVFDEHRVCSCWFDRCNLFPARMMAALLEKAYQKLFDDKAYGVHPKVLLSDCYCRIGKKYSNKFDKSGNFISKVIRGYNGEVVRLNNLWVSPIPSGMENRCLFEEILPDDVLLYILSFLQMCEIPHIARASKKLARVCSDNKLWQRLVQKAYGSQSLGDFPSWKKFFEVTSGPQWVDESDSVFLDHKNRTALVLEVEEGFTYVRTSDTLKQGLHELDISVNNCVGLIGLGISSKAAWRDKDFGDSSIYFSDGRISSFSDLQTQSHKTPKFESYRTGDIITLRIDLLQETVSYIKNFKEVKTKKFVSEEMYVFAMMKSKKDSVSIIRHNNSHYDFAYIPTLQKVQVNDKEPQKEDKDDSDDADTRDKKRTKTRSTFPFKKGFLNKLWK